jgi:soluble P-type ATPase
LLSTYETETCPMIEIIIPGYKTLRLQHLVLDVNGTIAKDGLLIEGVAELLSELHTKLNLHLVTADTHGRQETIDRILQLKATRISSENQLKAKLDFIERLNPTTVVAMGNGANDTDMLKSAALGIFIIGPEGSAVEALLKADIVAPHIQAGLELLLHPKRLIATLRR